MDNLFESDKKTLGFLLFGLVLLVVSGLFFGILYYVMDITETAFENTNCEISNNAFFDTCQDVWELGVYPFLALKTVLVYLSMFFIVILIVGMLLTGYNSGSKPYLLGVIVLLNFSLTYASLWVANIYRQLLDNEIIRDAMVNFSVYNKVMLNLPWFVFVTTLFALTLGIVNWQRVRRNTPEGELDY